MVDNKPPRNKFRKASFEAVVCICWPRQQKQGVLQQSQNHVFKKKACATITWSNVTNDGWENYSLATPVVRKIPQGYMRMEINKSVIAQ